MREVPPFIAELYAEISGKMGLKALDSPKSLFGRVHYLIMPFSKCALFLSHLESSSGLLETIAKMPLNVAGIILGSAGTDTLSLFTSAVLDASGGLSKSLSPSSQSPLLLPEPGFLLKPHLLFLVFLLRYFFLSPLLYQL